MLEALIWMGIGIGMSILCVIIWVDVIKTHLRCNRMINNALRSANDGDEVGN